MMHRTLTAGRRRGLRAQRGAVSVEIAFGMIMLAFVLAASIHFGDAMVVRQRLTMAASRAARICAAQGPGAAAGCPNAQVRVALGRMMLGADPRCQPLNVTSRVEDIDDVQVLNVETTCRYTGGIAQIVRRFAAESARMTLTAKAAMPLAP